MNDRVASGSLNSTQFRSEIDYVAQKNLLAMMLNPQNRSKASVVVDSFCNSKAGSTMHKLLVIDRLMGQDPIKAHSLNESFTPINSVEETFQDINRILIKYIQNPKISDEEVVEVKRISELCPVKFGPGVYQARSLRTTLEGKPKYNYIENCVDEDLLRVKNSETEEYEIKLSPNPSKGNFTIFYDFSEAKSARIEIYNITGQRIKIQELDIHQSEKSIELSDVVAGVYVCKFTVDGKQVRSQKIVIVK